jgi:hypothetical protein
MPRRSIFAISDSKDTKNPRTLMNTGIDYRLFLVLRKLILLS